MARACVLFALRVVLVGVSVSVADSHEIGLCVNLAAAQLSSVTSPPGQSLAALNDTHCMFIDPCSQQTRAGVAAPAGTWWHVSKEGLQLPALASDGIRHTNQYSLEYARVPQGVLLEVCQPDFSWFRQHGLWRCNEDAASHVNISGACPSTGTYTIFDCMRSTQFDARHTAAPLGSSQLVRYSLEGSWGCHAQADLPASQFTGPDTPNQVAECPPAAGKVYVKTGVACSFGCAVNYALVAGVCTFVCPPASTITCETRFRAASTCIAAIPHHYTCVECTYAGGKQPTSWMPGNAGACPVADCPAGTYGLDGECIPCAPNSFAASPGSAQCAPCGHGLFSETGSTACRACFDDGAAPACDAGQQAFASVAAIDAYFALYPSDKYSIGSRKRMFEFCHARGVCLPCQPGHYDHAGECIRCPFAEYQPHFQASACFQCAYGHNTSRTGSEHESECLCQPGFE